MDQYESYNNVKKVRMITWMLTFFTLPFLFILTCQENLIRYFAEMHFYILSFCKSTNEIKIIPKEKAALYNTEF